MGSLPFGKLKGKEQPKVLDNEESQGSLIDDGNYYPFFPEEKVEREVKEDLPAKEEQRELPAAFKPRGKKKVSIPVSPGEDVPDVINPARIVDLKDIPSLFQTIKRMLTSLRDLGCEFKLKLPDGDIFWLVPVYTNEPGRNEVSFSDAASLTVVCAAFGGTVESMRFIKKGEMDLKPQEGGSEEKEEPEKKDPGVVWSEDRKKEIISKMEKVQEEGESTDREQVVDEESQEDVFELEKDSEVGSA